MSWCSRSTADPPFFQNPGIPGSDPGRRAERSIVDARVLAGERRGWVDRLLGIFANALLAVPGLILLIAVVTVSGKSHVGRTLALALLVVPVNLRLARATTLRVASAEHVTVARILGTPPLRIILREIVPNVVRPLIAYTFVLIPVLVVADASLSFLGLGTPQPDPTWGNMIAEGLEDVFEDHPHIVLVPAAFMLLTVFSLDTVAGHLGSTNLTRQPGLSLLVDLRVVVGSGRGFGVGSSGCFGTRSRCV